MKSILSTTLALALVGITGQPIYAAPKEDKDKKGRPSPAADVAKKNTPSPAARASREVAARREAPGQAVRRSVAPVTRTPQIASRDIVRAPQARQTVTASRQQPEMQASRTAIQSRTAETIRRDSDRSRTYVRDNDRRDDDRRDNDRRDWDRRDNNDRWDHNRWDDNRHRSWQGYRFYRAPDYAYRSWDHNRIYSWNSHRYHWHGGSWVIIDPGYAYVESSRLAPVGSNVIAVVQSELQQAGYNPGPADGLMGGQTRSAIAQYQSDRGLRVTAQIDRPLLNSLGIN